MISSNWLSTELVLLDLALAGLILSLGLLTVFSRDLQRAVIMFIAFGLALSLAWVRLAAPDLALAEAAIGSGLTGVLLLQAIQRHSQVATSGSPSHESVDGANTPLVQLRGQWPWVLPALVFAGVLLYAIYEALAQGGLDQGIRVPEGSSHSVAEQVQLSLPETGVTNPVTAVLLNYRLYDTLLELAVLLAAALGVIFLRTCNPNMSQSTMADAKMGKTPDAVLSMLRWLVPIIILTAGYLLWAGAHLPGGAFQAGAMLAGAFALLYLSSVLRTDMLPISIWRLSLVAAITAFLASAAFSAVLGLPPLTLIPSFPGVQILIMEIAATLSVAATLALAVAGGVAWIRQSDRNIRRGG